MEIERLPEPPRRVIKGDSRAKRVPHKGRLKIAQLTAKGLKYDEIVEATGYSKPTIWRVRGVLFMAAVMSSRYWRLNANICNPFRY